MKRQARLFSGQTKIITKTDDAGEIKVEATMIETVDSYVCVALVTN